MNWKEMLQRQASLSAVDAKLAELKERITEENKWLMYGRAKAVVARHVGWFADVHTPAEHLSTEAFDVALQHVADELGV